MAGNTRGALRDRTESAVWQFLTRFVVLLIVAVLFGLVILGFVPEIRRYHAEKRILDTLRNELTNEQLLNKRHKRELDLLKNDPEYVEIIARDKMDLMREGETIFRLDTQPANRVTRDPVLDSVTRP